MNSMCTHYILRSLRSIFCPVYLIDNFSLIVYYMLVIKYGVSEDSIRRGVEPIMHFFAVGFGFGTAIAGLTLNLYNDANLWCWIASYPGDCRDSRDSNPTCTRGEDFWIYRCVLMVVCVDFHSL